MFACAFMSSCSGFSIDETFILTGVELYMWVIALVFPCNISASDSCTSEMFVSVTAVLLNWAEAEVCM